MSGWIEKLPSGRLRAVYRDAAGDRHSELFDNRKQAKAFLASAAADMARGQWVDPRGGQILFREWQETWFASRVMRRATARAYATTLRAHLVPQFGHLQLKQITPLGVRGFVTALAEKRRPKTVRNAHALLSNVLRDAVLEGLILTNPCLGIRLPRDSPYEAVFLSPAQIDRLVEVVPEHYRSLVQLAAGTGMRWGELTGLKRQRLDLLRRRVEVVETLEDIDGVLTFGQPKSARSRRTISLPPHLVEVMARHLEGHRHELVFVSEQGTPVPPDLVVGAAAFLRQSAAGRQSSGPGRPPASPRAAPPSRRLGSDGEAGYRSSWAVCSSGSGTPVARSGSWAGRAGVGAGPARTGASGPPNTGPVPADRATTSTVTRAQPVAASGGPGCPGSSKGGRAGNRGHAGRAPCTRTSGQVGHRPALP